MIRLLYLTHRWVGVALALFMLLWFSSGLIIANSGSVITTPEQRLAYRQTLNPQAGWLSLGEALELSAEARAQSPHDTLHHDTLKSVEHLHRKGNGVSAENAIVDARLLRVDDEPIWRIEDQSGRLFSISALDGGLREFSAGNSEHIARQWLASRALPGGTLPAVIYLDTFDAATSLRNYQSSRPFHRVAVDDGQGTELIVAAKTGEVLQAATRFERSLYYAGNFVHLFRPLDLLNAGELRRNTLLWAGLFAFVAGLSGMIIGWLRWKPGFFGKPTYSKGRTQPYREFYMHYHFWAGLIGGTFAVLWAFSGSLSTNPFQVFSQATASDEELARFRGGELPSIIKTWKPEASRDIDDNVVELGWSRVGDEALLLAYTRDGQRVAQNVTETGSRFNDDVLLAAVQRLAGETKIASQELLKDYDNYYYPNRRQGRAERPLPVLRVDLTDASYTSIYIDPQDGRLLTKMDTSRRAYRWLYTALHHWDFGWLHQRPLWTIWMTTWILFGLVLSVSSVVLGWRRLRRTFRVKVWAPETSEEAASVRGLTPAGGATEP